VDFILDPLIAQASHDERVRQAERAYRVMEALALAARPPKGANWLVRGWRRALRRGGGEDSLTPDFSQREGESSAGVPSPFGRGLG
jgi:hypothetical protein